MKKFVAILLTLMLVLGVSGALAADPNLPNATFKKNYTENGGTAPGATFTFTADYLSSDDGATGAGPELTISNLVVNGAGNYDAQITHTDKFPSVGKYYYTISEVQGNVAGITYDPSTLYLMVLVTNGDNAGKLVESYYLYTDSNKTTKVETFTNTYEAGSLKVTKTVTGNLGDKTKDFTFHVEFTAPKDKDWDMNGIDTSLTKGDDGKYTFTLRDGATAEFKNLPYGVVYTVTEDAVEGYTTTIKVNDVAMDNATGSIGVAETTAAFTNTKTGSIDTGVTTENLPYVLLIGFVVLAGAALLIKRKAHNN